MIDPQDSSASSDGESGDLPDDLEEQDEEVEDIGDGDSSYEQNGGQYGQPEAGPSSQNGITKTKSKFRPPTVEELDELHQAEASGGNTFSLQLEALLGSTLLPKTPHSGLKALLAAIHSHIMALPPLEALRPRKAVKRLGETIPFPGPDEFNPLKRSDIKWTLGWERPEEVLIGGSWGACGGYRKGKKEMGDINVVVTMPAVGSYLSLWSHILTTFSLSSRRRIEWTIDTSTSASTTSQSSRSLSRICRKMQHPRFSALRSDWRRNMGMSSGQW